MVGHESDRAAALGVEGLRAVFDHSSDAVVFTNPADGAILAANPAACRLLGMTESEICERGRDGLLDQDDPRTAMGLAHLQVEGRVRGTTRVRRGDGTYLEIALSVHHFKTANGQQRGCVIAHDVSHDAELEQALEDLTARLEALSVGDELTGLRNRRGLIASGTQLLEMADRRSTEVQVLFVDVRGVDLLNDLLGYRAGDAALQAVARALTVTFRRTDVVSRIGGTLFLVLALDLHEGDRNAVSGRIHKHLADPQTVEFVGGGIDVGLGWVTRTPGDDSSLEDLITRSDRATHSANVRV
jgi:diguanylate cyclase (GGDEF)-like protein/PAS domain S-box-containing protein